MADHNIPQWHGRAAQHLPSPANANSPLSPGSAGTNPISFQTNVNRAKTKRWVEAKQYSYDGGDWGDDDEEDEEEPPAPPQPPYTAQRTGSSSELSSRRLSGLGFGNDESRAGPSVEARVDSAGGDKALPFVRPVDLYKRMREDRPSVETGLQGPASQIPITSPPTQVPVSTSEPSVNNRDLPSMGLPEVERISSFGTDPFGGDDLASKEQTTPDHQQPALQHNSSQASSQGFTSVVHQAFDVPETPNSTTAGSVGRSNSDGTSVISPIISNRTYQDDKTPTIHEDPAESNTPTGSSTQPAGDYFKPGHRRDMSLPSRDNSPSKLPVVTDQDPPKSGHGEISAVTPGQNYDQPQTASSSSNPADKDFVAPLKIGSTPSEGYRGQIPTIVAGNSPEDADNDQLREEIMRSLSRENSQEPEEQPQSQGAQESIPHQYEKFWGGSPQTVSTIDAAPKPLVSDSSPLVLKDPYATAETPQGDAPPKKPKMARRFSWESSDGEASTPQIPGGYTSPPPLNAALAIQEPEPIIDASDQPASEGLLMEAPLTEGEISGSDSLRAEKPRLSIVLPTADQSPPPPQIAGPRDDPQPEAEAVNTKFGGSDVDQSKLQGFREILALATPQARIRAFDQTRDQFASLDSGLTHWLELTVQDRPEHAALVQSTQSLSADLPRTSPARSKFPKLGSLGNLSARDENAPANASHVRRPSGHIGTIVNRQNVAQSGKDLLHTAGSFGGKAGEAAKGLFAKGRSKFRPSGDKGQSTSEGRRKSGQFQFSFPSGSTSEQGSSSLRRSLDVGNLPIFRGRNEATDRPDMEDSSQEKFADGERAGKRFKRRRSMDFLRNTFGLGSSSEAAKAKPFSPNAETDKSGAFIGKSDFTNDFEQEMIAALGLSPTKAGAEDSTAKHSEQLSNDETKGDAPETQRATDAGQELSEGKSLPVLPSQNQNGRLSTDVAVAKSQPSMDISRPMTPSIRPVFDEDLKPSTPPKDLPSKDLSPNKMPSKDASSKSASLAPQLSHGQRQPSVSTLGADERRPRSSSEEDGETPPSPIQETDREAENLVHGKLMPEPKPTGSSLLHEDNTGFALIPRPPSSAEVLESKRRSISGLPPSAPGVQSPLRNEVRYSPGTRSSMLSFGSWGRQSQSRPATPANELSSRADSGSPAPNGDSRIEKLKSFGRRRRASVGDLFTGLQDNIQGSSQDSPEGGKRKRTFSRISDLFNRSKEPQSSDIKNDDRVRTNTKVTESKALPTLPTNGHNGRINSNGCVTNKTLPAMPAFDSLSMGEGADVQHDARRASMPLPPIASPDALLSARFYSSMSEDIPSSAKHTRVKSQPLMAIPPLSPIAPSDSNLSISQSSHLHTSDGRPSQELHAEEARRPQGAEGISEPFESQVQSILGPSLAIRSRKREPGQFESANTAATSTPENIDYLSTSAYSTHPHRDSSARTLNESSEPVELAITNDDTSEEIVMSPTAYPGQEWTPTNY